MTRKRGITYHDPPMRYQPGLNKYVVDLPTKPLPGEQQSSDKRMIIVMGIVGAIILGLTILAMISSRW